MIIPFDDKLLAATGTNPLPSREGLRLSETPKKDFMETFSKFITEQYGERCPDYAANCACCTVWRLLDLTDAIIMDDDDEL